jgi:hypothetical protein
VKTLPFLKKSKWPQMARPMSEVQYGFSDDDELVEQALDELMSAIESKDGKRFGDALSLLIELIRSKDASHPLEEAVSVP